MFVVQRNADLFSIECWQAHQKDRQNRRRQLQKAIEELDGIPSDRKIILGGDFNVSAHDGSLRILNRRLTDSFIQAGFGNGNTATNWIPLFRIDQVWCSKAIKPSIVTAKKSKLSDHRIVIAVFDGL
jgi:endonuclease/exonuclease/phosphatase (EEP) superfamily protein YafD